MRLKTLMSFKVLVHYKFFTIAIDSTDKTVFILLFVLFKEKVELINNLTQQQNIAKKILMFVFLILSTVL